MLNFEIAVSDKSMYLLLRKALMAIKSTKV